MRAVRPMHSFLRPDRRGPLHRPARARCATTGRYRTRRAVPVVLLGQHRADLPGGRTDRNRLPVPGPAVRPGVQSECVRTLFLGLCAAHRPPARRGAAPTGRRRPRGQRGVELRQGPVGVHLHRCGRSPHHSTGARRRRTAGRVLVRGARCRCRRSDVGTGTSRRPRRRQSYRRGRLRLRQIQPYRAEQQRHRLPGAAAQRRGGRVPGPPRRRGADDGHLLRCGEGPRRAPRRVRTGRGVTDRVPAAAEGHASQRSPGTVHRPVRVPGPREAGRNVDQRTSRRRGGRVVRARAPRAALDARSADPGR